MRNRNENYKQESRKRKLYREEAMTGASFFSVQFFTVSGKLLLLYKKNVLWGFGQGLIGEQVRLMACVPGNRIQRYIPCKKGGPGISPWHMKKKKVYLYKKGNCLCLILTIPWICEKSVLKFQKNCEKLLNKYRTARESGGLFFWGGYYRSED